MSTYQDAVIGGLVVIALADRFLLRRRKVRIREIGDPTIISGKAIAFPISIEAKKGKITGTQVEYWLRSKADPTIVISGKRRTMEFALKGNSREFLLIDNRYVESGEWLLTVRIVHGNSRVNPLYRVFPLHETLSRKFKITKDRGVFNASAI